MPTNRKSGKPNASDERYRRVMHFEHTMWLLFGRAAYGIAGSEEDLKMRRKWLLKAIKKLRQEAAKLDSTARHRQILLLHLGNLNDEIRTSSEPKWDMIYELLSIVMRLFGYDYGKGERLHTPIFVQNSHQHRESSMAAGQKWKEYEEDLKNPIRIRTAISSEV